MRQGAVLGIVCVMGWLGMADGAAADTNFWPLGNGAFRQDWSDTNQIVVADDWSGVPSLMGYRGDGLTGTTGADPRTLVAAGLDTPVDVIANLTNPNNNTSGGVGEFDGASNAVVALQGSATADAPFLWLGLDCRGVTGARFRCVIRDIDGSVDDTVQSVALQYRVGTTGDFNNVPGGYVADATTGPGLSGQETVLDVALPAAVAGEAQVELRLLTANADGSDEWVGLDDLEVTVDAAPRINAARSQAGADELTFVATTGFVYAVQCSANLTNWVAAGVSIVGDDAAHVVRPAWAGDCSFWRVVATRP